MKSYTPEFIPAFLMLLHLISDDDYEIRKLASEITATVLGEYMVSTPYIAAEKLVQRIGERLDPVALEHALYPIMAFDLQKVFVDSFGSEQVLFAKERENVWRDETWLWELYISILSSGWARTDKVAVTPFVEWGERAISAIREMVEEHEDGPLGWSREVDLFEGVVKVLLLCQALLKYGYGKGVLDLGLSELRSVMTRKNSHVYWIVKIEGILQAAPTEE
jgi:hypothetical protein